MNTPEDASASTPDEPATTAPDEPPATEPAPAPPVVSAAPAAPVPAPPEEIRYIEDPPATPAPPPPRAEPSPRRPAPASPQVPPPARTASSAPPSAVKIDVQLSLPNGMVGRPYDATATLSIRRIAGLPPEFRPEDLAVVARKVEGPDGLGLRAETDGAQVRIFGDPREAGDHRVVVSFDVLRQGHRWASDKKPFLLTINPDPRSLWKEIEPDASAPFRRPHLEKQRIVGESVLLAASRRGRSHANTGAHRDDAFALAHHPDSGWYIWAVADGAGSAPVSRRGAEIACNTAREAIVPHLEASLAPDGPLRDALAAYASTRSDDAQKAVRLALYKGLGAVGHTAYKTIKAEAEGLGRPPEDFATTLLFTIARRFDFGWFVGAIAIGDGGVGIYRRDGGIVPLNNPDSGDYAGQTRFLTMARIWSDGAEIANRILFDVVPECTAVVAMTDGVSDPKFSSDRDFRDPAKWHAFWDELSGSVGLTKENSEADAQLLEWLNFWAVGNHDDRTIAILLP